MSYSDKALDGNKPKTGIEQVLGETLVITAIGAVLYFWGILYYLQLAQSIGLGLSLFSVSIYEVIVTPWDNAVISLMYAALFWLMWHQRHILIVIAYYIVALALLIIARCVRGIKCLAMARRAAAYIFAFIKIPCSIFRKIPHPPDPLMQELNDPKRDHRMFKATLVFAVIAIIIGEGLMMPARARAKVRAYQESTDKNLVEVVCTDGAVVKGQYVLALGEVIIVDRMENDVSQRILIRRDQIKRVVKLLAKAPASIAPPAESASVSPINNPQSKVGAPPS